MECSIAVVIHTARPLPQFRSPKLEDFSPNIKMLLFDVLGLSIHHPVHIAFAYEFEMATAVSNRRLGVRGPSSLSGSLFGDKSLSENDWNATTVKNAYEIILRRLRRCQAK